MEKSTHTKIDSQFISKILTWGCLFFLLIDMATERSFFLFEITFIALLTTMFWDITTHLSSRVKQVAILFSGTTASLAWSLLFYLIVDAINTIYAPNYSMILPKYAAVISTGVVALGIVLYCNEMKSVKKVFVYAALAISLFSLVSYVFLPWLPQHYILRLSLRRDYNVFASVICVGYCFGFFEILEQELSFLKKSIVLGAFSSICIPVILLSGSRRAGVLLYAVLAIALPLFLFCLYKLRKEWGQVLALVGMVLVATSSLTIQTVGMQGYMNYLYYTPDSPHSVSTGDGSEMSALERLQTTTQAGAMKKRKIIWSMAWEEYAQYKPTEMLVGKGNGYDLQFFQTHRNVQLEEAYGGRSNYLGNMSAHSFVLADLLNGGAIKGIVALLLVAMVGRLLLLKTVDNPIKALPYLLVVGFCIGGDLISNRYGMLYDKLLLLSISMLLREACLIADKKVNPREKMSTLE